MCPVFSFVWFDAGSCIGVVFGRFDVVKDEPFAGGSFIAFVELRRVRRGLDAMRRDTLPDC